MPVEHPSVLWPPIVYKGIARATGRYGLGVACADWNAQSGAVMCAAQASSARVRAHVLNSHVLYPFMAQNGFQAQ